MSHTNAKLTFMENEWVANRFTIGADGNWLMSIQHNGEQTVPRQRENMRRLVACWNACEGSSTEWLELQHNPDHVEQFGEPDPFEIRYRKELQRGVMFMEQRGELIAIARAWLDDDVDDGTFADTLRLIIARSTA